MRHSLLLIFVVAAAGLLLGCPDDDNAFGGPYAEIYPGTDIDLGEVAKDTETVEVIQITNIGPRTWEMWINEDSIPNNIDFVCLDGATNDECLTVDAGDVTEWNLAVTSYCGDIGSGNIRLKISDPDSAGTGGSELEDYTITVTWTTTGC
jgi:hypothetical protein